MGHENLLELNLMSVSGAISTDESMIEIGNRPIIVCSCTVGELFSGCIPIEESESGLTGSLAIPEYQRPYVWGERQMEKLCCDLSEFYNKYDTGSPLYYLGSIIIHQDGEKLNIIDGQQRITSLLLLH